jgi:hypothetical protein
MMATKFMSIQSIIKKISLFVFQKSTVIISLGQQYKQYSRSRIFFFLIFYLIK